MPYLDEGGVIDINTNVLIEYLEKAFVSVVKDIRKKGMRLIAIRWRIQCIILY